MMAFESLCSFATNLSEHGEETSVEDIINYITLSRARRRLHHREKQRGLNT
jgi:hypothetical protein